MGFDFKPYTIKYPEKRGTKKIVHVIGNFIVGGSTQLVVDLIERTSDEYLHKVVVPTLEARLAYQPLDIRAFSIRELQDLSEWLKDEEPELVHIHYFVRDADQYTEGALWYQTVFDICEDLGLKVVQNINVPTHPHHSSAIVHNVFVSEFVDRNYNNSTASHSVIYPGSDFSHFRNDDVDSLPSKSIGMVYRLDDDKLRSDAIEVFIQVAKQDPEIRSYIVGNGLFLDDFKQRVREEKLEKRIIFTGLVSYDKLPEMYKKFSIFVAPVHDESFGQVTPFAMSMGQCVAGYNTGAIPEILGYIDTLVTTGDVNGLAKVIVQLANNPKRRKELGSRNRQRSNEQFAVGQMIAQYRRLYHRFISAAELDSNS